MIFLIFFFFPSNSRYLLCMNIFSICCFLSFLVPQWILKAIFLLSFKVTTLLSVEVVHLLCFFLPYLTPNHEERLLFLPIDPLLICPISTFHWPFGSFYPIDQNRPDCFQKWLSSVAYSQPACLVWGWIGKIELFLEEMHFCLSLLMG